MDKRIPTRIGDVLILRTDQSFTIHAVGQVTKEGQQDFDTYGQPEHEQHQRGHLNLKYEINRAAAVGDAKAMVVPGRRIFFGNIDTGDWTEISTGKLPLLLRERNSAQSNRDTTSKIIN